MPSTQDLQIEKRVLITKVDEDIDKSFQVFDNLHREVLFFYQIIDKEL